MPDPRAFISFDYDNNKELRILFAGQAKNPRTPFDIEDWSSKEKIPQKEWEELIKRKINKCNMLIVLVGKKAYAAAGVKKEITFAKSLDVPVFGVYVDGANDKIELPEGLIRTRVVDWDGEEIAKMISMCMKEGKNKK